MLHRKASLGCFLLLLSLVCSQFSSKASQSSDSEMPTSAATVSATLEAKDLDVVNQTKSLFSRNATCVLPCWWGFQPRKATIAEIQAVIMQELGRKLSDPFERSDGLSDYFLDLDFHSLTDYSLEVGFVVKDTELISTRIVLIEPNKWLEHQYFELSQLLEKLGKPTEVYVGVNPAMQMFALYLIYRERGVVAEYNVNFEGQQFTESTEPIQLCPRPEQIDHIKFWLQANADDTEYEQTNGNIPQVNPDNTPTLQMISGQDLNTFTKFFQVHPNGCLALPSYSDLSNKGYFR